MKIKLYCIFAKESILKMGGNRGKMSAQAGHAYLHAFWNAMDNDADNSKYIQAKGYQNRTGDGHAYKIALIVDTVDELKVLQAKYKDICGTSLVTDAGFTVFDEPTTTCLGIGPISEDNIGDDIKALKTFC
jgi:peptidyl-tRNA hydrolase